MNYIAYMNNRWKQVETTTSSSEIRLKRTKMIKKTKCKANNEKKENSKWQTVANVKSLKTEIIK
jgi:hypothetical protein